MLGNNGYSMYLHIQSMTPPCSLPYNLLHRCHYIDHNNVTYMWTHSCNRNLSYIQKNMTKNNWSIHCW